MASNVIDLDRAEQAVSPLLNSLEDEQQRTRYKPKTIKDAGSVRYHYLPLFPSKSFGARNRTLLANVPGSFASTYFSGSHRFAFVFFV
jgi:hypothetical protein